jgi:hypothetical protein
MATNAQGKIITFYSYKGGVGRSMILANVAWILASNGKQVLVVDWDLEAPGLHRYFHPFLLDKDLSSTEGLMEFFTEFLDAALTPSDGTEGDDDNWHEPYANILRYAASLNWKFPKKGTIDFVPAGKQGKLYATQVNLFNWQSFYERFGGGIFLESVRKKMRAEYDYILIDSRTGVSDTSGICTVQMPDILVVIFSANDQSILGAAGVATSINKQWQADKNRSQNQWSIFPVLARTDRTEKDKLDLARNYSKTQFAPFLQHISETEREEYWGNVEIPYIPWYAYEEVLVTFRDNPHQRDSLLAAIEQLVSYLTNKEISELVAPNQVEREDILSQFTRRFSTKSYAVCLLYDKEDGDTVKQIATYLLEKAKLEVWFEQWNQLEGESWEQNMKRGLEASSTCAVFVGSSGKLPWQRRGIEAALRHQVKNQGVRVIPVLLPNTSGKTTLPSFMSSSTWLEFRSASDEEALWYLEREIKGVPYGRRNKHEISSSGALVPGYLHDIFVSYARVDNQPLPGTDKGWVTTLVNGLKNLLGQKLGRIDAYSLWMDYELRGNEPVTPDIAKQLENTAILLVILSPGYLASQWCRLELNRFLAKVGKNSGRVFVVERDEVQWPDELSDLLGYKFWVKDAAGKSRTLATPKPNPHEVEYYQKLDELAHELNDKIKSLK